MTENKKIGSMCSDSLGKFQSSNQVMRGVFLTREKQELKYINSSF